MHAHFPRFGRGVCMPKVHVALVPTDRRCGETAQAEMVHQNARSRGGGHGRGVILRQMLSDMTCRALPTGSMAVSTPI
jgi:hypothetical protein